MNRRSALAAQRDVGHYASVLRAMRDTNIRLTYAAHRRPYVYAIVLFGTLGPFYLLLSGSVLQAAIFGAVFAIISIVRWRSQGVRRRFARWSAEHPLPPSRSGT